MAIVRDSSAVKEFARRSLRSRSSTDYRKAAREILSHHQGNARFHRVNLISNVTTRPLAPYLVVEAAHHGHLVDLSIVETESIAGALLQSTENNATDFDVVILMPHSDVELQSIVYGAVDGADGHRIVEARLKDWHSVLDNFRRSSSIPLIIHGLGCFPGRLQGLREAFDFGSRLALLRSFDSGLASLTREFDDVWFIDEAAVISCAGMEECFDAKNWYLARAPYSAKGLSAIAGEQASLISAIASAPKKALVVDLDGTLWGGVLGEDGPGGIQYGNHYPGNVFRDIQRHVKFLHRQGVFIAVSSKNDEDQVRNVFEIQQDFEIGWNDFAAIEVGWHPKSESVQRIADHLNIGLDSIVFLDDNPAERERMKAECPEVLTLDSSGEPLSLLSALQTTRVFDRLTLSAEDRSRAEMVRQDEDRRNAQSSDSDARGWLFNLGQRLDVSSLSEVDFSRAVELIAKTNQFNVTTKRRGAAELRAILRDDRFLVVSARASDRFGNLGLIGMAIVELRGDEAQVDTLLLSCRAMGRDIELAILSHLCAAVLGKGYKRVCAQWVASAKNAPCKDVYDRAGFALRESSEDLREYVLDLSDQTVAWPPHIQRVGVKGEYECPEAMS